MEVFIYLKVRPLLVTNRAPNPKIPAKLNKRELNGERTIPLRSTLQQHNAPPRSCCSEISIARWQRVNKHLGYFFFSGLMAISPLCRLEFDLCKHFCDRAAMDGFKSESSIITNWVFSRGKCEHAGYNSGLQRPRLFLHCCLLIKKNKKT